MRARASTVTVHIYRHVLSGHGFSDNRLECCFAVCLPPWRNRRKAVVYSAVDLSLTATRCLLDVLISPLPRCFFF